MGADGVSEGKFVSRLTGRAWTEYGECLRNPTSSCYAKLRLMEENGLYFPIEDEDGERIEIGILR